MKKTEFSRTKGSIVNINIEATNMCNAPPRPAASNGLIAVKLKCDLKYRSHANFEPVCLYIIYQVLICLKLQNKF